MDKTSIKWFIAGLSGTLLVMVMFGVFLWGVTQIAPNFTIHDGRLVRVAHPEKADIREVWSERQDRYAEEKRETQLEIDRLGLEARYETVPAQDDTRTLLFEHRYFEMVDRRLQAELKACKTPLDYYHYSHHIEYLAEFARDESPPSHLAVLDAWVAARPESHHARLVRARFGEKYLWNFHLTTVPPEAEEAGWVGARELLAEAWDDLEVAAGLNPEDPEVATAFLYVGFSRGMRRKQLASHFDEARALCPAHLSAWQMWIHIMRLEYGGTSEQLTEIADQTAALSNQFPLLLMAYGNAMSILESEQLKNQTRQQGQAGKYTYWDYHLDAYEAQLASAPGDLHMMAAAARCAVNAEEWGRAVHWFRALGDTFPQGNDVYPHGDGYNNVAEYNRDRARAYAMYADMDGVSGTSLADELRAKAQELHPSPTQ